MPKVYDTPEATLVVNTNRQPNPAAQAALAQRQAQEQEIIRQRRAGTAMGQVPDHNNMGNTQPAPPQDSSKLKEEW